MAAEALLSVEDLVAGYGPVTILRGASLEVAAGAVTTVIGPNGAGKSTLMKAVFGLLPPRGGRVRLAGEEITGRSPRELLARGLVFVPQGRNLFPELTVRHNLELGAAAFALPDLDARVDALLARFPLLGERAGMQASVLSGGEQKLLEIARALLLEPRLLLVDEPSLGLSPKTTREIFAILTGLRDRGVAVLMIEQNAKSALGISDVGIVLDQGRVARQAPAAEILADPRIGRLFLGGGLA